MESIIKNQLLKHLSRYTKNLSIEKINVKTTKGEGELENLQLDENIITNLLELPAFLRITSAWVNKVRFRIPYMNLSSESIELILDDVHIKVEICEFRHEDSESAAVPDWKSKPIKFISNVIDGIKVIVNMVHVNFISPAFCATIQILDICVESMTPKWMSGSKCLQMTRLKDAKKETMLLFKELRWQVMKIEAFSTKDKDLAPLRLVGLQTACRLTIKKSITDRSIISSRLILVLGNLSWQLTDSQLTAAFHFADSLSDVIKASTEQNQKTKATEKLKQNNKQKQQSGKSSVDEGINEVQMRFNIFDVQETSYHFCTENFNLTISDVDDGGGRSCHPDLNKSGSLVIRLEDFQIDYYPFHLAKSERNHWPTYPSSTPLTDWFQQSLNRFRERLLNLYEPNRPPNHAPLERSTNNNNINPKTLPGIGSSVRPSSQSAVLENLDKLMCACVALRIGDVKLNNVTTKDTKNSNEKISEILRGDKDRYTFPMNAIIHAEFIYFYYPGDLIFPLPSSKFFVHVNPVELKFDMISLLWLNSFALNMHSSILNSTMVNPLQSPTVSSSSSLSQQAAKITPPSSLAEPNFFYMDVKIEVILPRVVFEMAANAQSQRDRPKLMVVNSSRITITNVRETGASRADLAEALHSLQKGSLVFSSDFPARDDDLCIVTQRILAHANASDEKQPKLMATTNTLLTPKHLLWNEPRDIWCIKLDPIWAEFQGIRSIGESVAVQFIDNVPITLWINGHTTNDISWECESKVADLHVIAHISNMISIQLDHYQLLFLLRLSEQITEMSTFLAMDRKRIMKENATKTSMILGCFVPQVEVTLVMPSMTPGKETTGGDIESVVQDSISLMDDMDDRLDNPLMNNGYSFGTSMDRGEGLPFDNIDCSLQNSPIIKEKYTSNSTPSSAVRRNIMPVSDANFGKEISSGIMSIRKGLSSLKTSMDSTIKTYTNQVCDTSDTMSTRSDASSDSGQLISLSYDTTVNWVDRSFRLNVRNIESNLNSAVGIVEMASEVVDESEEIRDAYQLSLPSPSEPSDGNSWKRRDLVSMVIFRLAKVELIRQMIDTQSALRLQVAAVNCDECGAIPWDELQKAKKNKFAARCRSWNLTSLLPGTPPAIQIRLEDSFMIPPNDYNVENMKQLLEWIKNGAEIRLRDIKLDLQMSTVTGLGDLIEDEIISRPLPLVVHISNVGLTLIEDRPPVNLTSPGPVPINLSLGEITVHRQEDGVFYVEPKIVAQVAEYSAPRQSSEPNKEILSLQLVLDRYLCDNNELRQELEATRIKSLKDTEILKSYLQKSQDQIETLLEEKMTLLDRVRSLQHQLTVAMGQEPLSPKSETSNR